MKKQKEFIPVSNEEVQQILNENPSGAAYGCGSGCGSGSGSGSGCGGWHRDESYGCGCATMGLEIKAQPYPGIKFSDNVMANTRLATQLTELLHSSQTLRTLLDPYIKGYSEMTFDVRKIEEEDGKTAAMETDMHTGNITINSLLVGSNGFDYACNGKDSSGYEHDNTVEGSFSAAIGHEAVHARHYYWYRQAYKNGKTDKESAEYLKSRGFSDEFVNIFFQKTVSQGWKQNSAAEMDRREHKYLAKHEFGVLDDVRSEYKDARAALEQE